MFRLATIALLAAQLYCTQAAAQTAPIRCDDQVVIDLFKQSVQKGILHFDQRSMRLDIDVNDTISISEAPTSAQCRAIARTKLTIEGITFLDYEQTIYYSVSRTNSGRLLVTTPGI